MAQERYEVRFDWGVAGVRAVGPSAGLVVVVDALPARGVVGREAARLVRAEAEALGVPVWEASLRNRSRVARQVLEHQHTLGHRAMVAVIAVGEPREDAVAGVAREAGAVARQAWAATEPVMEDFLAAGAVVEALQQLGVDACSPEAAAAAASFSGLRRALTHLFTASTTGVILAAQGRSDEVRTAARLDAEEEEAEGLRG